MAPQDRWCPNCQQFVAPQAVPGRATDGGVALGAAVLGAIIAWGTHPTQPGAAAIGLGVGFVIGLVLALARTHPRMCPICKTRNLREPEGR